MALLRLLLPFHSLVWQRQWHICDGLILFAGLEAFRLACSDFVRAMVSSLLELEVIANVKGVYLLSLLFFF